MNEVSSNEGMATNNAASTNKDTDKNSEQISTNEVITANETMATNQDITENEDVDQNVEEIDNESMSDSMHNLKGDNPWDISSIYDLALFFCPECHFTSQSKQDLVIHASSDHPWVSF